MSTISETEFREFLRQQLSLDEQPDMDQQLSDLEAWDSLAMVMFVANVDAQYAVAVDGNAVAQADTVRDLYELLS